MCEKLRALGEAKTPEATKKLEAQLEKSFPMYPLPKVRPIVLETLKQLTIIPQRILDKIVEDKQFYSECAINVQQQIWLMYEELFLEAVGPVVENYLASKAKIINVIEVLQNNFFTCDTVKNRRQHPQIKDLLSIIGDRPELFEKFIAFLQRKFVETENRHYCSLRVEYSMAARDQNIEPIVKADLAQDLACCMDACLREKHMDAQQTNRLKSILDGKKKAAPKVIAELAMIAADSHILHFIGTIASKLLRDMAAQLTHLPRDHGSLQYLLRILQLGLNAKEIITGEQSMPSVDSELTHQFLPLFVGLICEDVYRLDASKMSAESKEEILAKLTSPVTDQVRDFVATHKIASFLWMHYCWSLFPTKNRTQLDMVALLRYVDLFSQLCDKMTYRDPWVHLIVHRLLVSSNLDTIIGDDSFIKAFFENYLLHEIENEPCVKYQVLRLCHLLHQHMGEDLTKAIMAQLTPSHLFPNITPSVAADFEQYDCDFKKVFAKIMPQPVVEGPPALQELVPNPVPQMAQMPQA
ncbi:hypothetical protein L596_012128 [Steinernema carpocapsae]|uniref:Negative elongation factor B n=1 Tax=Steinernema carpocapsae TaxID=34508 RepID=A0A4U5NWR9_STECR|nr:hypothetical protein L596_012128 [Steinernema carpocapsae]